MGFPLFYLVFTVIQQETKITCVRVVKGIFVTRDRPFFFPVKCEMAIFFFVNCDFIVAVKRDFANYFP